MMKPQRASKKNDGGAPTNEAVRKAQTALAGRISARHKM